MAIYAAYLAAHNSSPERRSILIEVHDYAGSNIRLPHRVAEIYDNNTGYCMGSVGFPAGAHLNAVRAAALKYVGACNAERIK